MWGDWSSDFGGALESRELLSRLSGSAPVTEVRVAAKAGARAGHVVNLPDALVYIPAGLQPGHTYPMVVAFTPDGKIQRTLGNWRPVADRFRWIVYVSKQYSNNAANSAPDFDRFGQTIWSSVSASLTTFPVDQTRLVLAGFSGGGAFAEYLNSRLSGLAAALVIDGNGLYTHGDDPGLPFPDGSTANSRRLAAFLYSPADRRYGQATRLDRAYYQQRGWSTLLMSYAGGHVDAPPARYLAAATWIARQPAWYS